MRHHNIITMGKKTLFTEKSKLYELVAGNPKLLQLLPRFGIQLGFGDRSVDEVCKKNDVSTEFFLIICNVYSDPDFTLRQSDFKDINMDGLLPYLRASHRYYLDECFPHIEEHLARIIDASGPKYGPMLSHFYAEYKEEVVRHIQYYEEEVVFPYIEALRNGKHANGYNINEFRHNHSNIEDVLEDMMNILVKYLPGNILPTERLEISLDIMELTADLSSHSLIEDHILIPYVESLENALP